MDVGVVVLVAVDDDDVVVLLLVVVVVVAVKVLLAEELDVLTCVVKPNEILSLLFFSFMYYPNYYSVLHTKCCYSKWMCCKELLVYFCPRV